MNPHSGKQSARESEAQLAAKQRLAALVGADYIARYSDQYLRRAWLWAGYLDLGMAGAWSVAAYAASVLVSEESALSWIGEFTLLPVGVMVLARLGSGFQGLWKAIVCRYDWELLERVMSGNLTQTRS